MLEQLDNPEVQRYNYAAVTIFPVQLISRKVWWG